MGWLRRLTQGLSASETPLREPSERSSPGLAALFKDLRADETHSVLDLGPASDSSLRVFSRFAGRARFADLLRAAGTDEWAGALAGLPEQRDQPYDLILAWDILDRLPKEERPVLCKRLAEVSSLTTWKRFLTSSLSSTADGSSMMISLMS